MARRWGAAEAARRLLVSGDIRYGFRRLVQSGRPELTVEWSALRELAQLAQASNFKTRAAKKGALDAQLHAGWSDKLTPTLGVSLASVAPSVWHGSEGGR